MRLDRNGNLLRRACARGFPADLDGTAIETVERRRSYYTWRDIERATAMLANLLESLELPAGARIAVQAEKSVESLLLYLAVLRAGHVYLPLNTAYKSDEIGYFLGNAEPACSSARRRTSPGSSKLAFAAGTALGVHASATTAAAACSSAPRHFPRPARAGASAAATTSPPSSTPAARPGAARGRC